MHRAGVPIMAGPLPMKALQATTSEPASFLGTERDTGTITRGKIADLVVLNANPLDDNHEAPA
jgi:imidazolonepropionase-like amidohydrolase